MEVFHCQNPLMSYLNRYINILDSVKSSKCRHLVQYSYYNVFEKYVIISRPKFSERLVDRMSNLSENDKIKEYNRMCKCLNELHSITVKPSSPKSVQSYSKTASSEILSGGITLSDFYITKDDNNKEIVVMDNYSRHLIYKAVQLPFPITVENINTLSYNYINKVNDRCFDIGKSITKNDDIWSIGCILFKVLKDVYPFEGKKNNQNLKEIEENIKQNKITDYSNLDEEYKKIIKGTITTDAKNIMKIKYIQNHIENIIKTFEGSKVVCKPEAPPPPPPSLPDPILLPCSKEEQRCETALIKCKETHTLNFYGERFSNSQFRRVVDYFCRRLQNKDLSQVKKEVVDSEDVLFLNLEGNRITHDGINSLITIFKYMPNLTKLYLNSNNFGNKGAIILADNLYLLPNLKVLDISHNKIKDEGLSYLCKKCKKGLTVHLHHNKYSDYNKIRGMFNNRSINTGDARY